MVSPMIDHLIVCVGDLDEGARTFSDRFGLSSVEGGRHPGHGTANRIIPLGGCYIELLAVVDPSEAKDSPFGNWAGGRAESEGVVDAVCIRTDDLDAVCTRLGLKPTAMSRRRPDGTELKWSVAGVELAIGESLPFFVEWHIPEGQMPGRTHVIHEREVCGVEAIVLSGDLARLKKWTDGVPTISAVEGPSSIVSVGLATPEGPLDL
jgi:Glyoxalase-like domain